MRERHLSVNDHPIGDAGRTFRWGLAGGRTIFPVLATSASSRDDGGSCMDSVAIDKPLRFAIELALEADEIDDAERCRQETAGRRRLVGRRDRRGAPRLEL
jgi:hypothetical protein